MDTTTYVVITTKFGDIKLKLYDETPLHKANFIKIVKDGVLDGTLFHRIIPEFMIQGGDPDSKNAVAGQRLGMGGLPYKVPAELTKNLIHKKGALAAARDGNPQKASSSTQFYIVAGKKYTEAEIQMLGSRTGNSYTDEQKKIYMEQGGTPMLDMAYTVFGEVVSGLDIIDKIVSQPRDGSDRPNEDVKMTVKILENK
ncbi:MAG: peptidylprolyl isomerase [Saprospirales bacterium]|nr:peptidylprolyl isomerase [Saprospirales bacterium]